MKHIKSLLLIALFLLVKLSIAQELNLVFGERIKGIKETPTYIGKFADNYLFVTDDNILQIDKDLNLISSFEHDIEKYYNVLYHFKIIEDQIHLFKLDKKVQMTKSEFIVKYLIYDIYGEKTSESILEEIKFSREISPIYGFQARESKNGKYIVFALQSGTNLLPSIDVVHVKIELIDQVKITKQSVNYSVKHKCKSSEISDLFVSNQGEIVSCLKLKPNFFLNLGSNLLIIQNKYNEIQTPIEIVHEGLYFDHAITRELDGKVFLSAFRVSNRELSPFESPIHDKLLTASIDIENNKIINENYFDIDPKIYEDLGLIDKDGKIKYDGHYVLNLINSGDQRYLLAERQYKSNEGYQFDLMEVLCFKLDNRWEIEETSILKKASWGPKRKEYESNYFARIDNGQLQIFYNDGQNNSEKENINEFEISPYFVFGAKQLAGLYYANLNEDGVFDKHRIYNPEKEMAFFKGSNYYIDNDLILIGLSSRYGGRTMFGKAELK